MRSPASAGGFLALVAAGLYQNGQTGGRGYIGLAAMIFGNWRPGGLLLGVAAVRLHRRAAAARRRRLVHALLLVVAIVLLAVARLAAAARGTPVPAIVTGVRRRRCSSLWFLATDEVPRDFTGMTPYVTTLLVLAFASQRLRMPAADGQIYRKGSGGLTCRDADERRLGRRSTAAAEVDATHAYAPYSHFQVGAAGAGRRRPGGVGLQRRERGVRRRRCAPSAAWSPQLHTTGGGRLTHVVCVERRRRGAHAVRAVPAAAVRERRPGAAAADRGGRTPMDEVLPDAFGPDDLER